MNRWFENLEAPVCLKLNFVAPDASERLGKIVMEIPKRQGERAAYVQTD